MRVLVTGAAGFIGYNFIKKLLKESCQILGIDSMNSYYSVDLKKSRLKSLDIFCKNELSKTADFNFVKLDLCNYSKLNTIISDFKPTHICHLAAQPGVRYSLDNPNRSLKNNIFPTLNLLESAKENGIKEFIFSSTSSVYGLNSKIPFNEEQSTKKPISVYSSSKLGCESLCHTYSNVYNINVKILRFFTVYGPWGRPDMSYSLFAKSIFEGKKIDIFNNGNMSRDFTYIDDIINGVFAALKSNFNFEIFNLGSGNPISLIDFIKTLEEIIGIEAAKNYLPLQAGDIRSTWADVSKSRKLLNFNPQTDIKEGLTKFVDWYKAYYKI